MYIVLLVVVIILFLLKDILLPIKKESYEPDEYQENVYDMKKDHLKFKTKPTKPLTFLDENYVNSKQPFSSRSDPSDELYNTWTLYQNMVGNIVN